MPSSSTASQRLTPERSPIARLFHRPSESLVRGLMSMGASKEEARDAAKCMKTPETAMEYIRAKRIVDDRERARTLTRLMQGGLEGEGRRYSQEGPAALSDPEEEEEDIGWEERVNGTGGGGGSLRRRRRQRSTDDDEWQEGALVRELGERQAQVAWICAHGYSEQFAAEALAQHSDPTVALQSLEHTWHVADHVQEAGCSFCRAGDSRPEMNAGAINPVRTIDDPVADIYDNDDADIETLPGYTTNSEYRMQRREEEEIQDKIRQHHLRAKKNQANWGRQPTCKQVVAARAQLMFNPRARWDDILYEPRALKLQDQAIPEESSR